MLHFKNIKFVQIIKTILFGLFFGLTACCTKKDCDNTNYPILYLKFLNAPSSSSFNITITRLDKSTNNQVDSYIQGCGQTVTFYPWLQDKQKEALNYNYVISGPYNTPDTIFGMTYNKTANQVKCNTCFPTGNGDATVIDFKNFQVQYKGVSHKSGDTLFIN